MRIVYLSTVIILLQFVYLINGRAVSSKHGREVRRGRRAFERKPENLEKILPAVQFLGKSKKHSDDGPEYHTLDKQNGRRSWRSRNRARASRGQRRRKFIEREPDNIGKVLPYLSEGNGAGVMVNGMNGAAVNGMNGAARNGMNGAARNGMNGVARNGMNGAARNGMNGAAGNGMNGGVNGGAGTINGAGIMNGATGTVNGVTGAPDNGFQSITASTTEGGVPVNGMTMPTGGEGTTVGGVTEPFGAITTTQGGGLVTDPVNGITTTGGVGPVTDPVNGITTTGGVGPVTDPVNIITTTGGVGPVTDPVNGITTTGGVGPVTDPVNIITTTGGVGPVTDPVNGITTTGGVGPVIDPVITTSEVPVTGPTVVPRTTERTIKRFDDFFDTSSDWDSSDDSSDGRRFRTRGSTRRRYRGRQREEQRQTGGESDITERGNDREGGRTATGNGREGERNLERTDNGRERETERTDDGRERETERTDNSRERETERTETGSDREEQLENRVDFLSDTANQRNGGRVGSRGDTRRTSDITDSEPDFRSSGTRQVQRPRSNGRRNRLFAFDDDSWSSSSSECRDCYGNDDSDSSRKSPSTAGRSGFLSRLRFLSTRRGGSAFSKKRNGKMKGDSDEWFEDSYEDCDSSDSDCGYRRRFDDSDSYESRRTKLTSRSRKTSDDDSEEKRRIGSPKINNINLRRQSDSYEWIDDCDSDSDCYSSSYESDKFDASFEKESIKDKVIPKRTTSSVNGRKAESADRDYSDWSSSYESVEYDSFDISNRVSRPKNSRQLPKSRFNNGFSSENFGYYSDSDSSDWRDDFYSDEK